MNRPAVEAGLDMLDAGGDFADGVIDLEGRWLAGETFVTFDKKAAKLLAARGHAAEILRPMHRPGATSEDGPPSA